MKLVYELSFLKKNKKNIEMYGFVDIFDFNKTHISPYNTVLMKTILQAAGNNSEKLAERTKDLG